MVDCAWRNWVQYLSLHNTRIHDQSGSWIGNTAATSYPDSGLTLGTTYYYKATSVNASGESALVSNQASATPAPLIGASIFVNASTGAALSEQVLVAGSPSPITNATVTINGTSAPYNSGTSSYVGGAVIAAGASVTLSVTIPGDPVTYTVTTNQFTTYPTIITPAANATWLANSNNQIAWTVGAPVTGSTQYVAGVTNNTFSSWPFGNGNGPNSYPNNTPAIVPGNTIPAGSWNVVAGIEGTVSIPTALPGSVLVVGAASIVPITVN